MRHGERVRVAKGREVRAEYQLLTWLTVAVWVWTALGAGVLVVLKREGVRWHLERTLKERTANRVSGATSCLASVITVTPDPRVAWIPGSAPPSLAKPLRTQPPRGGELELEIDESFRHGTVQKSEWIWLRVHMTNKGSEPLRLVRGVQWGSVASFDAFARRGAEVLEARSPFR